MSNNNVVHIRLKGTKPVKLTIYANNKPKLITLKPISEPKFMELQNLMYQINEARLQIEKLKLETNIDRSVIIELDKSLADCVREFVCLALDPIPKEYVYNIYEEDMEQLLLRAVCYARYKTLDNFEEFLEENKKEEKEIEEEKKSGIEKITKEN